jgi:cation diffusion facilitator family transporter
MEGKMLTNWMLRLVLKGKDDYTSVDTRLKVGYFASIVGIILNITLAISKVIIGSLISSIGVVADGVNNFADTASSMITLIGFKLSSKPADKNHPYGHGRLEYIAALMVAFMVILVGLQFVMSSVERIRNPKEVLFELVPLIILIVSILVKIWLSIFNKNLGEKINSGGLKATATDAFGDVLITTVVVISIVASQFTDLPIDGFIGLVVSVFIIFAGLNLVKDTISPLIGEAPSKELIDGIYNDILEYDYITGAHDLFIHFYGANRAMATIDVEVPGDLNIVTVHDSVDKAERELGEKYGLAIVIHMDPLAKETKEVFELRNKVKAIVKSDERVQSIHDFLVLEGCEKNIVEFHAVIDQCKNKNQMGLNDLKKELEDRVLNEVEDIECRIIIDLNH